MEDAKSDVLIHSKNTKHRRVFLPNFEIVVSFQDVFKLWINLVYQRFWAIRMLESFQRFSAITFTKSQGTK